MPKFLERKLKKEYPNNPSAVYGTMNKIGAMKGNKETSKGKEMQKKHEKKVASVESFRSKRSMQMNALKKRMDMTGMDKYGQPKKDREKDISSLD